ncbi:MAG TPA: DUF2970 domain-containing protein [Nevskia sp.]|nr:DUF2970 domain-containing protein [Nevskia sp.]
MNRTHHAARAATAEQPKLGWFQTLFSILASVIGVQSWSHFERDITRGSPVRYAVTLGALMVAFILVHVLIVHLLLRNTGLE